MSKLDYIDTRKATIQMLRDWNDKQFLIDNAQEQLREINSKIRSVKSVSTDSIPVQGGANKAEENLCKAIDRKNTIERGQHLAQEYWRDITPAWEQLTHDEQFYLRTRFIDCITGNGIKQIMQIKHIEQSEAYRRSDSALDRLRKLLFW